MGNFFSLSFYNIIYFIFFFCPQIWSYRKKKLNNTMQNNNDFMKSFTADILIVSKCDLILEFFMSIYEVCGSLNQTVII